MEFFGEWVGGWWPPSLSGIPAATGSGLDRLRPEAARCAGRPVPGARRLREEDPVHWSGILGGWVLTRYADVRAILADPRLSADRITPFLAHQTPTASETVQALLRQIGLWVVFTDPPAHTRLRNSWGAASRARDGAATPAGPGDRRALLERASSRGEMDLIRDFAYPLPVAVIGDLLGVPPSDRERLKAWSDEVATFVGERPRHA